MWVFFCFFFVFLQISPDLVVLGVLFDDGPDVIELLPEVVLELLEEEPPVVPDGVVGRVQLSSGLRQLQGTETDLLGGVDGTEVVVHVLDWIKKRTQLNHYLT